MSNRSEHCNGIWLRKKGKKLIWISSQKKICTQTRDDGYNHCTQTRDDGYNRCTQTRDDGYSHCCTWWPCSWGCKALVWISNIVCIAWTWVSNIVCIAWTWIIDKVWSAWIWVDRLICCPFSIFKKCLSLDEIEPNPIEKKGWILTFHDEFNNGSLDLDKWLPRPQWAYLNPFDSPSSHQYFSEINHAFTNSAIKLIADYAPKTFTYIDIETNVNKECTIEYSIQWLETKEFRQQFGYFEIRCKIPDSLAMWPAFWFYGDKSWPPEIDVFEVYTSKNKCAFESNYHWGIDNKVTGHPSDCEIHKTPDLTTGFHIYGLEWNENELKWYFDNILVRIDTKEVNQQNIPFKIVISTAVDKSDRGQPQDGNYPNFMEVDYVRGYKR